MNVHLKRDFAQLRSEMVETAISSRGVRSELVLNAMRKVPRESFLPQGLREFAYEDAPLPIEEGQTISQPYIVAFMTEALVLQGGERVLEIGAGSGYAAAILSEIAGEVYTVERIGQLAEKAASTLADLGYHNVHVLHGDGTKGWPEHAPYDGIIVAAGRPTIPGSLKEQLRIGGRLVIPVGRDPNVQELFESPEFRSTNTIVRIWRTYGLCRWWGKKVGPRPNESEHSRDRHSHPQRLSKKIWRKRLRQSANHLNPSTRRSSIDCSPVSATQESCCSARPPTGHQNSTKCGTGSRAS